jgi:hypothetical protein
MIMLENTGGWSKQKPLAKAKGYKVLVVTDKCVSVTATVKLHSLNVQSKTNIRTLIYVGNSISKLQIQVAT